MVGLNSANFSPAVFEAYQEHFRDQLPPALVVDGDVIVQVIGDASRLFATAFPACPFSLSELPKCDLATRLTEALDPSNRSAKDLTEERFRVSSVSDPSDSQRDLRLVVFPENESIAATGLSVAISSRNELTSDSHSFGFPVIHQVGSTKTPVAIIWSFDEDGHVTFISDDEVQFTGIPMVELMADGWKKSLHPDDADKCLETINNAISDRQPFCFNCRKRRVDGEYVWFKTHGLPRFDLHGAFLGHTGFCLDITEQIKVQNDLASEQRMTRAILDNSPFLSAYANVDLIYQYVNSNYAEFWDRPREQIIGRSIPEVAGTFFEVLEPYLKQVLTGETVFHESKVCHESGKTSLLEITHVPAFDANESVIGFYCFVNDVTTSRKHDRLLNLVLSNVSAMILFLDTELELRYANQQFLERLATQEQDVIGKPIKELIGFDAFSKAKLSFDLALQGQECTFECQIPTSGNGCLAGLIKLVPEIEDGVLTGICGLVMDVSDLRSTQIELQRSEARFELAVSGSSIGIIELDIDNPDWVFADHVEGLLGFEIGEMENSRRLIRELVHPEDIDVNDEFNQSIAARIESKCELRLKTKTGQYRWFEIFTQPARMLESKSSCVVGTIADIDDLKTAQLESANQVRLRDEFLAMLSHELRNPMASILLATECLQESDELPERFASEFDIIGRQSRQITGLLNDLLDVSRVTLNRIEFKKAPLDLNCSVSESVNNYLSLANKKHQRILLDISDQPCLVVGDEFRLAQAISNLLENAIKYTPEGGEILVSTDLRDDQVVLSVRDSGIGIEANKLGKIFDLFFQEHVSIHRSDGGLGVGLFMVQHIVQAHDGVVVVKSEGVGLGCLFEICLPSSIVHQPEDDVTDHLRSIHPKVVLIEDNDDARFVIDKLLTMKGFEVVQFAEGESASIAIPMIEPEVAIIDIGLPGKSGLDLAREFRSHPKLKDMLLIALTGYGQETDRDVVADAGFDVHLVKPVTIDSIIQAINSGKNATQTSREATAN